jgi:hypothetical protein
MSWHEALSLEIIVEFQQHNPTEELLYQRSLTHSAANKRIYARDKATVVGVGVCVCGKEFTIDAEKARRGKTRVCASSCPVARNARAQRFEGKTFREWSEILGISATCVRYRVKRHNSVHI